MRKRMIALVVLPIISVILSGSVNSNAWEDPYPDEPGTYHCYHIGTGDLVPTSFAMVWYDENNHKQVTIYPCPDGLWYSCSVQTFIEPGDKNECDCLKRLPH